MSHRHTQQSDQPTPAETDRCSDFLKAHLRISGTIFEALSEQEWQQADQCFHPLSVPAGDKLYTQGDLGDTLIYIIKGRVTIESDSLQLGQMAAGSVVGEMALFIQQARSASVTAVEDCELLLLQHEDFTTLREANSLLAYRLERTILKSLSQRMRTMTDRIKEEMSPDNSQRRPAAPSLLHRIKACLISASANKTSNDLLAVPALRQSGLFDTESEQTLSALACLLHKQLYRPESFLCHQGDSGKKIHFVLSGQVAVEMSLGHTDGSLKIATVSSGGVLGLMDLADHQGSSASCIAESDVSTFSLDRQAWDKLFTQDDHIGSAMRLAVIREFCKIISSANEYVSRL